MNWQYLAYVFGVGKQPQYYDTYNPNARVELWIVRLIIGVPVVFLLAHLALFI